MTFEDFENIAPCKWIETKMEGHNHVWLFRKQDCYGRVHPNVSSFGNVSEWQSEAYRLSLLNNVRIDGMRLRASDLKGVQCFIEKEIEYLLTIKIPDRVK